MLICDIVKFYEVSVYLPRPGIPLITNINYKHTFGSAL